MIFNRKELADCFGVDESTVLRWADDGMPVVRDRQGKAWKADPAPCIAWFVERTAAASDSTAEVSAQRARLLKAQADRAEIELGETRGRVVDVAIVRQMWAEVVVRCRARLLQLPRTAAPRLPVPPGRRIEVEDIIRKLVYEALTELAEAGDGIPGDVADAEKLHADA